jgi:SDR family mycofactocin-dependent oxidoreductase
MTVNEMEGKVVLITGGARGMGRSHAVTLAGEGADIVVADALHQYSSVPYELSTADDLAETERLVKATGRRCLALQADVASAEEMKGVVDAARQEFGHIDGLVANAGIWTGGVPAWELSDEQWDQMSYVNLRGVWQSCKQVIPHMLEQGTGSIVLISSMAGMAGMRNFAHYVATKHGVVGLMRALAVELGGRGLRVNAVSPQATKTDLLLNQFSYDLFAGAPFHSNVGTREDLDRGVLDQNLMPVGPIDPSDISNAILWLLSDRARYVTGVALPVDAGALVEVFP